MSTDKHKDRPQLPKPHEFKPGDPCWIVVGSAEPEGRWIGEIVGYDPGLYRVTAKIVDGRVKDHPSESVRHYYGRSPTECALYPYTPEITALLNLNDMHKEQIAKMKLRMSHREEAFLDAIKAIHGDEVMKAVELVLKKL
jgi:hypothetical protein